MSAQPCKKFQKSQTISFLNHVRCENCSECQAAIGLIRVRSKIKRIVRGLLLFAVGAVAPPTILGAVGAYWPFWPASHAAAYSLPLRAVAGNAQGCLAYHITLLSDRGFEDAYLKFRFPMRVTDVKAGTAKSEALPSEHIHASGMEQFTKDENGDCKIGVLKQVTETEVSTKIIERAVEIQLGKIPTRMAAVIAVVGNDDTALGKPQPPLVHEGFFEWTMLGYRAKRAIQFFDEDVRDFQ